MIGRRSVLVAFGLLVAINLASPVHAQLTLVPGADLRGADLSRDSNERRSAQLFGQGFGGRSWVAEMLVQV